MPSFGEAPFMIYTFGQEAYFRRHLFSLRIVDYRHGYFYGRTGLKDLSPSPTKNHPPGFQGNYTGGGVGAVSRPSSFPVLTPWPLAQCLRPVHTRMPEEPHVSEGVGLWLPAVLRGYLEGVDVPTELGEG